MTDDITIRKAELWDKVVHIIKSYREDSLREAGDIIDDLVIEFENFENKGKENDAGS